MSNSSNKNTFHIGVLGAMPEEIGIALNDLNEVVKSEYGDLVYSGRKGNSDSSQINIY